MRQLDVYLGENLIGHVVENRKGGRFEYEQAVVDKLAGRPVLSMAFPAKGRPFGEAKTSAWFNGLLPEGSRLDEICRSLGVSPYDWIGLLAEIGWECAGAVRVFERGRKGTRVLRFEKISPSALAEKGFLPLRRRRHKRAAALQEWGISPHLISERCPEIRLKQ